jgi:hypothetical protein
VRNGGSFGSFVDGLSRECFKVFLFTRELCRRVASRRSRSFVHFGHDTSDAALIPMCSHDAVRPVVRQYSSPCK